MSFEDDAYWESEYTDRSPARHATSRRQVPAVDELAVRRKPRQGRYRRPPRRDGGVQKGFDPERPSWLDDPDFVPTDVSEPDLAGHGFAVLDFNRPELGAIDAPSRQWTGNAPQIEDDDWDDEIDEPFDHRVGMDRPSTVRGVDDYTPSPHDWDDRSPEDWDRPSPDDWDDPSPENWGDFDDGDDLNKRPAGRDEDVPDLYRRGGEGHDARPDDTSEDRDGPRVVGRASAPAQPRIISQAGPPPVPKSADPAPAPRVLDGPVRVTPTPATSATITAPPAVGIAPVSPASAATPIARPAVATAPVSPASAATSPVSSPAATAPVATPPAPSAGARPPLQRPPADIAPPPDTLDQSTPDTQPRRYAGDDEASRWFAARPSGPAAIEAAAPAVLATADAPHPQSQPAAAFAPEDLRAVRWRLDGATLREVVDDPDALGELGSLLDGPLAEETNHIARAGLLSLRAEVYRLLGELGMAAAASRLALAHAESARDGHAVVIAQAELAHVLRLRGHYPEADRLLEEAASSETPELLRSVVHEYAGRSCFDQGRHMEALDHFARAIRLGAPDDLDLVERIDVCLEAVYIHVLRDGWGPYPRMRREILGAQEPSPTEPPPH